MDAIRLIPQLRTLALAVLVGLTMAAVGLLAAHYGMKASRTAAENRQLRGEVRDLVMRLVEVEEVLHEVGHERGAIEGLTLAALGAVIDTAGLNAEAHGRVYQALSGNRDDDRSQVRRLRTGPPASAANYAALVARMTSLRGEAQQLVQALHSTSRNLASRQEILAAIPSRLPAKGWLSSDFGVRHSPFHGNEAMHYGIDIAAEEGTPVFAPADGIVTYASVFGSYGKLVKLDHDFGISTRFGHNAQILVKKGQRVQRGEAIAVIGNTGRSTGPHVHYEILLHGKPVDPARFVLEKQQAPALMSAQPPRQFTPATPHGTGGDADLTAPEDVMAVAADPDLDPTENQPGLLPWISGERLILAQSLPNPLGRVTTTDLYLVIAVLMLLLLVTLLIRIPDDKQLPLFARRFARTDGFHGEAGLPAGLGWSLWAASDTGDADDDLED